MGSNFSSCDPTRRNMRYLIGDISELSALDQKLFRLSGYALNPTDTSTKSGEHGIPIVQVSEEIKETNKDNTAVSADEISVENVVVNSLFMVYQLKKKLYLTQTFIQWKANYRYEALLSCCKPLKRTVYIQPVDNFPDFIKDFEIKLESYKHSLNFFTFMQTFAEVFFSGMTLRLLPSFNLLNSNWNIRTRVHSKTGQKQYLVGDFFTRLSRVMPPDGYCIMGMIWTDLYPCEALNFVLGEASNLHKAGIHCFGRYEPKSYDADTHRDITEIDGKLIWKLIKVFSHELCHLFGLGHCAYFLCSMNESGSMAEAYSQPLFLCPVCLRKLQHACDFDILHRYKKLKSFMENLCTVYPTFEIRYSAAWLKKMIEFLETDDQDSVAEKS